MESTVSMESKKTQATFKRKVVIIMPFGSSGDCCSEREAILHFMRVKEIVENHIDVIRPFGKEVKDAVSVEYKVRVAHTVVGSIPETSLELIIDADIVIAIITGLNANVIFELALRNLAKRETLLIVRGNKKTSLPIALQGMAYIDYDDKNFSAVDHTLRGIANHNKEHSLSWNEAKAAPEELKTAIEKNDQPLIKAIQRALIKLETNPPPRPPAIRNVVAATMPENLLREWNTFVPWSVIRIQWRKCSSPPNRYDATDVLGEPVVCQGNKEFLRLFDLAELPDAKKNHELTYQELMSHVRSYINDETFEAFNKEQQELTQRIIFEGRNGVAVVPLHFNKNHSALEYQDTHYLPCLVGKRLVGNIGSAHTMFLLVMYVKDFWPYGHPENRESAIDSKQLPH